MNYKNLKHIPTQKLQEILNSPHCTGINGADYEPVKEELTDILFERLSRFCDDVVIMSQFEQYEDYLDSMGVPPVPTEALMEIA